jgi:hypothetical protein
MPVAPLTARAETLGQAARAQGEATTLAAGHSSAESMRNLVVGPTGPENGDTARDGEVQTAISDCAG